MLKPNIEELIIRSGLRKGYIAEILNVSVRQLRKYETGESYIPIDKAYVLSRLINVKVDDLYEYTEDKKSPTHE